MSTKYTEYGKHSVRTEIRALQSILDNSIDSTFEKVVNTILKTKGRVILSGVGKPSYIAHRIAATFASTGTPAHFVHANEASHGDLGMILEDDTVIVLSNSGGSKEINDIIAYCKRYDITLIGITRNPTSFLATASSIPVILENIEETTAVNSPTTSIIMMLAYLDAVATALINARRFDKDNYKILHPGGKLGSALLKVEEIMHNYDEVPLVYQDQTMEDVVQAMIKKPLGCVGILNKQDGLVGIITDGDFKRQLVQCGNLCNKPIAEVMTKNPITVEKDAFALDAVKIMEKGVGGDNNYIQVLLVTRQEADLKKVVGLIHIQDCLRSGVL